MQSIAGENNLSETAFFVPCSDGFELRWFTPVTEVDLCGHATLAAGYVVCCFLRRDISRVRFHTKSGTLDVHREDELIVLDLPSRPAKACEMPNGILEALGNMPEAALEANAYLFVFPSETQIANLRPDFPRLAALPKGVIVTAPGITADFVSRYFAPSRGVPEDPVTGSAHCTLVPYWSQRLGKNKLTARQISRRGGDLFCEDRGSRVQLAGHAALYLEGTICT
jgi:PhzF family phenazine biosynthesis protein